MAMQGKIVVDTEKCKGCLVCIPVCPTNVIEMSKFVNGKGYNFMEQARENCTGCTSCAQVCPDGVITVYRVRV